MSDIEYFLIAYDKFRMGDSEPVYDGDEELRSGLYVPPHSMAVKIKCNNCGVILFEHQVFKNDCIRCRVL